MQPYLGKSPLKMFSSTVSAMSSALCPVTIFSAAFKVAPRSRACRRKTPQNVQLFLVPTSLTISSMVQPYSSLYETTVRGILYCSQRKVGHLQASTSAKLEGKACLNVKLRAQPRGFVTLDSTWHTLLKWKECLGQGTKEGLNHGHRTWRIYYI